METEFTPKGKPLLRDDVVRSLISCRKYIPASIDKAYDRNEFEADNGQYRRKIQLRCGEQGTLTMIMRQLQDDPLDFSVILMYVDPQGYRYIIRRYNGDHGMHIDRHTGECIQGPHIHTISERCQMTTHKDEGSAVPTDRYSTLPEAVEVFIQDLNIQYERAKGVERLDRFRHRRYPRGDRALVLLQDHPGAQGDRPLPRPHRVHIPGR